MLGAACPQAIEEDLTLGYETILLEKKDGYAIVTLNRPEKLNVLSTKLMNELDDAISQLEAANEIKAVIVTGAGDRAFCAGGDINEMVAASPAEMAERRHHLYSCSWHLFSCRKPTIGVINGIAYGGGALFSSLFDMRFGCERTKFRFLAVTYGLLNSSWSLPLLIGMPMAKELLYTGREVRAEEAFRIGLLNKLTTSSQLMAEAEATAATIAKNDAHMVQAVKTLLHEGVGNTVRGRFDSEEDALSNRLNPKPPSESFAWFAQRKGNGGQPSGK